MGPLLRGPRVEEDDDASANLNRKDRPNRIRCKGGSARLPMSHRKRSAGGNGAKRGTVQPSSSAGRLVGSRAQPGRTTPLQRTVQVVRLCGLATPRAHLEILAISKNCANLWKLFANKVARSLSLRKRWRVRTVFFLVFFLVRSLRRGTNTPSIRRTAPGQLATGSLLCLDTPPTPSHAESR